MEILISDLIFKLGKANQQMYALSKRVAELEQHLQENTTRTFPLSHSNKEKQQIIAQ